MWTSTITFFSRYIWNIPDGFATIVGGTFVLIASWFALLGVNRQIKYQSESAARGFQRDRDSLRVTLYSELMNYFPPIVRIMSDVNKGLLNGDRPIFVPHLIEPFLFKSNHDKLGILQDSALIMSLLGFHVNLMTLTESMTPKQNNYLTPSSFVLLFRRITGNLCEALSRLGPTDSLPLPDGFDVESLTYWNGTAFSQLPSVPSSFQEVLSFLSKEI